MAEMTPGQSQRSFSQSCLPPIRLRRLFVEGSATLGRTVRAWSLVMSRSASMRTRSPPLHFWQAWGHLEGVRLLLAQEVDVDRQTACGYTPLLFTLQDKQAPGALCRRQPGG